MMSDVPKRNKRKKKVLHERDGVSIILLQNYAVDE